MVSLVSQHSLEGEHRLWVAQATFDWVGWQHVRTLACLLLACCVRTGEGARSSAMPLSCTGAVASSRRVATQPRISQAWVHTARGWRRPLSTGSAGSTCGRLRICCSLAVCGRGRAHARALYVIFILNYDYNRSNSRRDKHSRNRSSPPANKYHSNLLLRINTILRSKV